MFYREYRPKTYSELIGMDDVVSILTNAINSKRVPHAYFFTGSRGTGKTTTARIFAKSINCSKPVKVLKEKKEILEPCNKCKTCSAVDSSSFPDLIELDGASYRGIDNIRDITDTVKLAPSIGKSKVYIIDEVHMLTTEASNALLKTLEEPPEHVFFILCTTNPEKVIPTIKSRCIQIKFTTPSINSLVEKLKRIATDKKLDIADDKLIKIAIKAGGAYRDAETYLEQFVNLDSNENSDNILYIETQTYENFVRLYKDGEITSLIKLVNDIYSRGTDMEEWSRSFLEYLRALLLYKIKANSIVTSYNFSEDLISLLSLEELAYLVNNIKKALSEFKNAIIPVFPLELCIVDLFLNKTETLVKTKTVELKLDVRNELKELTIETEKALKKEEVLEQVVVKEEIKVKTPEPEVQKPKVNIDFSFKKLLETLKENNNSIYTILASCIFDNFDGKNLNLLATYSFHKERVLSVKNRTAIENAAKTLVGSDVRLTCNLITDDEKAKRLTDKNVEPVKNAKALEEVFEDVFGEELASEEPTKKPE